MRNLMAVAMTLSLLGCSLQRQAPELVLLEQADASLSPVVARHSQAMTVGPEEKPVPLTVSWTTMGLDDCLRIASIKVERTGGSKDTVGSSVALRPAPCGSADEEGDPTRYASGSLFLRYDTRVGLQTQDFMDHVALIDAHGDLKAQLGAGMAE